jgi:TonB-dependent SusC/RagA subfamily outer membrane receptor
MNAATLAPQVAAWMTVSVLLSAVLAVAAMALHRLARGAFPTRLVWSVALGATVVLVATQPLRRAAPPTTLVVAARDAAAPSLTVEPRTVQPTVSELATRALRTAQQQVTMLATATATVVRTWPMPLQWGLLLLWPLTSVSILLIGAWSYRRQRQTVHGATVTALEGFTVHVTPNVGPAVFGMRRPSVVIPAWLLSRPADEQRLVVQHERAHIAAHDPLLLLSGCIAVAVVPWNPVVWYLLSRLRLAIELDCDARVLAAGASTRRYGELLIDLSAASAPLPMFTGAPAFSHRATHLERRIRNMTDRPGTLRTTRRFMAVALTSVALLAACGAELPTSAELEGMDVAAAQQRAEKLSAPVAETEYVIDGKAATAVEARGIVAERIASIDIRKKSRDANVISITTRNATGTVLEERRIGTKVSGTIDGVEFRADSTVLVRADGTTGDTTRTLRLGRGVSVSVSVQPSDVLIFVDGVKATEAAMKMSPDRIQSIEVIKGAAAEKLYGPEGAKGVIRITTKK